MGWEQWKVYLPKAFDDNVEMGDGKENRRSFEEKRLPHRYTCNDWRRGYVYGIGSLSNSPKNNKTLLILYELSIHYKVMVRLLGK